MKDNFQYFLLNIKVYLKNVCIYAFVNSIECLWAFLVAQW